MLFKKKYEDYSSLEEELKAKKQINKIIESFK